MSIISFIAWGLALLSAPSFAESGEQQIKVRDTKIDLDPNVQHVPLDPSLQGLRPPPPNVPDTFDIFIGLSVFRDGYRCGRTLLAIFSRATHPERLHVGLVEQIFDGDLTCLDEYCKLANNSWPDQGPCRYKDQIQVETMSAGDARGCTTARHIQQKLIRDEEFCLQVDAHSNFVKGWDELLLEDWTRADNEMAVLMTYPHANYADPTDDGELPHMWAYPHLCAINQHSGGLVMYPFSGMIYNHQTPQLGAYWGGGLSFGKCHAERNAPVDPHLPWLWSGEEFLRSAILWTHGYDLYSPSENGSVVTHNYTKNANQLGWKTNVDEKTKNQEKEMSVNRYKLQIGLPVKGRIDTFELDKYSFGTARSFSDFIKFTGSSFKDGVEDYGACGQLHWVPYANATVVEEIVGGEWKLYPNSFKSASLVDNNAIQSASASDKSKFDKIEPKALLAAPLWVLCGAVVATLFVYVSDPRRRQRKMSLPLKHQQ